MTLPAPLGPDRDLARTEALASARGGLAVLAFVLIVLGLVAAVWPLTNGATNGIHLVAPLLVAAGGFLLTRIRVTT